MLIYDALYRKKTNKKKKEPSANFFFLSIEYSDKVYSLANQCYGTTKPMLWYYKTKAPAQYITLMTTHIVM